MNDPRHWYESVDELAAQGLLTPDAAFNKFNRNILRRGVINKEKELPHLQNTFDSLSTEENGTKRLTQSAFLFFLESRGFLPPSLKEAGAHVYRSLLYLSQYPFYESIPEALSYEEFIRALAWTMPERPRVIYDEDSDGRTRTPADSRRKLFQSFATVQNGQFAPFDVEHAKKQAERRAFTFTDAHARLCANYPKTNYDDDGDEMFHDILDTLYAIQPKEIGWAAPPRDSFRPTAKKLVGSERVHQFSIPQEEFRALVKLLVATYHGKPRVPVEQDTGLDHVVDCIVHPVVQNSDSGVTWDMFEEAIGNGAPLLWLGLERFLWPFYKGTDDENVTRELPPPGKIAAYPVMAQLNSLDIHPFVSFCPDQYKYYDVRTTPVTASTLEDDISALPLHAMIFLLSGKNSQTGEKTIFGYYLPIEEFGYPPFLFQLSGIQDAFRGKGPRPGRKLENGELVFGQRGNGTSLVLQNDSKKAIVSHKSSGQDGPMYAATSWRGDWEVEVEVEEIEMWLGPPPPDFDDYSNDETEQEGEEEQEKREEGEEN
ncbi:hypothetical protein ASPWEDRAFT_188343 [Aspergillus wentii DTO 134E9]|uniref:Uncharacterized protein n=1 Tax=Aspergillus wentii DTO 134E9 TaxID=1073089 RepID=A0A1L9R4U3_ASPWE|nr:uncharacterized protein ASPWEDRAFT_188343 [Aspergillus wentii DTO 134E9]KAI9927216.1 hypothetical protein MW887_003600 [Aspergillus wentii]OJJ29941.1 hypothetical protein ASPWEDRAFT_188343 [Aspergillus wentii DTO 134E9]